MTTNNPIAFEISRNGIGGFELLAIFADGKIYGWSKRIKTERGAKARKTAAEKRFGIKA